MLAVISPAKTLDYETPVRIRTHSQPDFLADARQLIDELRGLSPPRVAELMKISPNLADLNFGRFLDWSTPFNTENARQAILAFKGDVYTGLEAETFKSADFRFAQKHLRILSGLYGLLRPLDLMQPYRLEMGTKFANRRGRNLYEFWGDKITHALNRELVSQKQPVLINLASNEYFKSVQTGSLDGEVITPVFKDWKGGKYKVISFFAKKARGMMSAYMIRNRIREPEELQGFDGGGYAYNSAMSSTREWVFVRDQAAQ